MENSELEKIKSEKMLNMIKQRDGQSFDLLSQDLQVLKAIEDAKAIMALPNPDALDSIEDSGRVITVEVQQ